MYSPCTVSSAVSFSFDDYSNLLYERFDKKRSPYSQCCSCCSCCTSSFAIATPRLSLKASLFYGLRQSTLIQLSPCRRLIFGRDRYYYRIPAYGLDYGCYEVSCCYKDKNDNEKIGRIRKGRLGRQINLRETRCLSNAGDAEAVINLLSEEVTEYLDDRNGNMGFSKRVQLENSSGSGGEYKQREKNVRLGLLGSDSKWHRREEERGECKRKEERKEFTRKEEREEREERKNTAKRENRTERKASSSFSSYYPVSSTGDSESGKEAQDEFVGLLEESSSGYEEKLWSGEDKFEGLVGGECRSHGDAGQGKVLGLENRTTRTGAEWDLRKKSEKKLTEIDEIQSRKESSQLYSIIARTSECDYGKFLSSHKHIDNKNDKLNIAVNVEKGTRKQYNQIGDQVTEQSQARRKYQEVSNVQDVQRKNVKRTSLNQRLLNDREENLLVDVDLIAERSENRNTDGESTGKTDIRRKTLQFTTLSEIENLNTERVSNLQRQSESRLKIREDDRTLRSVEETNEKHQKKFGQITGEIKSRSTEKHFESEVQYDSSRKTSTSQSETGTKNQEGSAYIVYHSGGEGKEQRSHTSERSRQRLQSSKGSQDVTNKSVNVTNVSAVNATDKERVDSSQLTSEKRMTNQGGESASVMKSLQERRGRNNQTDENITLFKSRNDVHIATEVSSFEEKTSKEASSSQASLNMVDARMQQIDVEGDYGTSQSTMIPPSPQMVRELYGRDRKLDIYEEPLKLQAREDAMGSAHLLDESSMQFVGEFMETARKGVLTAEIQKEKGSNADLVYEDEDKSKSSGKYGSIDLQLKEQDSKGLSGGSGVKGPSDEIWDVAEHSFQEPKETEALDTLTQNTVVRRTGKSFWNIIADIVRLLWGSHSETPKAVRRSGGKSSSNDSVTSEAWFSGHDPEENRDKNVERERSMPKEATSSHHLQLIQASSQGQGEVSDTIRSMDMTRQLEGDTSRSSIILKSGSTSKGISSPSEEEHLILGQDGNSYSGARSQDGKSSQFLSPSAELGDKSSATLPSSGMRTPIAEESYGRDRIYVPISGSGELMEQPSSSKSTVISGPDEKAGELKQRRLQRTMQVVRDRFDEWEEAYIRESEQRKVDEMFMREALLEAKKAADIWEVPVGAVLVQHGKIIARGYNLVEELRDSTAHAEMICIREASNNLRTWRLSETTLYVTLEPCPMCAGAILQARVDTLVWGAPNKLLGADGSWIRLFPTGGGNGTELSDKPAAPVHPFHPKMTIRRGVMEAECADVMQQFFQLRRRKKAKNDDDLPPKPSLPIAGQQSKIFRKMHDMFHSFFCL